MPLPPRSLSQLALLLVLQVALGLVLGRACGVRHRTLAGSGEWVATKTTLERGVMGAESFMKGRQAVEGRRLNLGAWFGFQEVLFVRPLRLAEAEFSFELYPEGYLYFIYDKRAQGSAGLRFSLSPRFPSMHYTASALGEFEGREAFALPALAPRTWHRVRVRFGAEGLVVDVDGAEVGRWRVGVPPERAVGFRGGRRIARLRDVVLREKDAAALRPASTVYARFEGWSPLPAVLCLLAVMAANAIALAVARGRGRGALLGAIVANGVGLLLGLLVLGYLAYSAPRYPALDAALRRNEEAWKVSTAEQIRAEVRARYPAGPHPGLARVLFLGTSQTWGAGAARKGETFVEVLEGLLSEHGRRFECVNGGISAADSSFLLDVFRADWIRLEPDMVVINLGNNDGDPERLAANVGEVVRLARESGARSLLVLEPNTSEDPASEGASLRANHGALRRLGEREGVPVVDMHAHLARLEDRGFLWWDSVHLTSFGQRLFAERLRPEIEAALVGAPAAPSPTLGVASGIGFMHTAMHEDDVGSGRRSGPPGPR